VHPSGLLDALIDLFEGYWARAVPLFDDEQSAVDEPDPYDILILRLLNAGFKDHAIARQLGLSQRTATRWVGMLMARLGAGTRFQCGVAAAKRGWI
jgi:DNA-binding NarL/FixJ family response regulator